MKKKITLEITENKATKARRRARQAIGPVKPQRVELPATRKPPKHKKKVSEEGF